VCSRIIIVATIVRARVSYLYFFFFQAEDGIRDRNVTGVQTCALPILFTTPSGNPASLNNFPTYSKDNGVSVAGFITTVQPTARAEPNFHAAISSGKFHGIICPTTPTGSCSV